MFVSINVDLYWKELLLLHVFWRVELVSSGCLAKLACKSVCSISGFIKLNFFHQILVNNTRKRHSILCYILHICYLTLTANINLIWLMIFRGYQQQWARQHILDIAFHLMHPSITKWMVSNFFLVCLLIQDQ